ncbi:MAG: heme o synthase [Micropepsaceae bacterium]
MSDAAIDMEGQGASVRLGPAVSVATAGDFFELLKPRVMSLVVFTGLAGLVAAPGVMNPIAAFVALLCIAVGAGASGALNMWYDADIDAVMARTARRPIPSGRVTPQEALTFGLVLSGFSVFSLGILVNWLSAGLLAFTIVFYVAIYTMWLKRSTPQNIVIGGLAGAMPPAVGWAAATGSLDIAPLVMVALIFLWTPAHFWALALYRNADYARAGVPMMPVVAGEAETRRQIVIYTLLTVACSFAPVALGFAGIPYLAVAALTGAGFIHYAFAVYRAPGDHKVAMKLFAFSILYLFLVFAAFIAETAFGVAPLVAA